MKPNPIAAAAILAFVLALGLSARLFSQYRGFNRVVNESLATSEGYDQRYIDMVNHLEDILTTRASFPYPGGKDPMTGKRREVAAIAIEPIAKKTTKPSTAFRTVAIQMTSKVDSMRTNLPEPPRDMVRLTAIIADDYSQHTAIVMDGERSLSVDVGDMVGNRRVVRITSKELTMEDDSTIYTYGLSGSRLQQQK